MALTCLAYLILGLAHSATSLDRIEAAVNGSIILQSDVDEFRKQLPLRSQIDPLFSRTDLAAKGEKASEQEITNFLIDEALILQKYPIPDVEVEKEIREIQAANKISRDALTKAIQQQGFSFENYFNLIRIGVSKKYLLDRDIRTKVYISDEDIKNFYYNSSNRAQTEGMSYRIKILMVSAKNYNDPAAAKTVAERALQEVRAGEPFEDVAKRLSDDSSKDHGGDLGFLSLSEMSKDIKDRAPKMKVGDVSDVLGNDDAGFFIFKLADLKSNQEEALTRNQDQIRTQLTAKEYQHQIELWLERQRQEAVIHRAGDAFF